MKTIKEINDRIRKGEAVVVSAEELPELYEDNPKKAAKEVDIVTTGTFGAMCSSGAFLNLGHSDPPIKIQKLWLNNVEAYAGLAAVDAYIGATELSRDQGLEYGGAHVIEDLVAGKEVKVEATAYGTDCYPRKKLDTNVTLDDLNQAILFNPRNNYQRYNAATNSTNKILYTYMGTLLPNKKNVNYAGTGELSPLNNDPRLETIGVGTKIFLGGTQGFVAWEGTQHSPKTGFSTLSVIGDLKEMSTDYLKAATMKNYGTTLYIGIGIPIPILNEKIAKNALVRNKGIKTNILDYGVPRLKRPIVTEVSYEELSSGKVDLGGRKAKANCLSSLKVARKIVKELTEWIHDKEFYLTQPVRELPKDTVFKPMKLTRKEPTVGELMTKEVVTAKPGDGLNKVCNLLVKHGVDQLPVVDREKKVAGIVTSLDVTRATAKRLKKLDKIMTKKVITSSPDEPIDVVSLRLNKNSINSTPVVDNQNKLLGIITMSDINRYYQRRYGR